MNQITFGWAIHLSRCNYLDENDDRFFSFNIVRPGATEDPKFDGKFAFDPTGPDINGENAHKQFADLLFPWKWESFRWKLFGNKFPDDANKTKWEEIKSIDPKFLNPVDPGFPDIYKTIRDSLEYEIKDKTNNKENKYFFRVGVYIEKDEKGNEKYIKIDLDNAEHLVPKFSAIISSFIHLPALVANEVLHLGGIFSLKADEYKDFKQLCIFPVFKVQEPQLELKTPAVTSTKDKNFSGIEITLGKGDYSLKVGQNSLVFFCNLIDPTIPSVSAGLKTCVSIKQETLPLGFIKASLFADYLSPLRLLAQACRELNNKNSKLDESNDAVKFTLLKNMVNALGCGWEKSYLGPGRVLIIPHVLERLASDKELDIIFGIPWRSQLRNAFDALSPVALMAAFTDSSSECSNSYHQFNVLSCDIESWRTQDALEAISIIGDLASSHDRRQQVYAVWLPIVLEKCVVQAGKKLWDQLKSRIPETLSYDQCVRIGLSVLDFIPLSGEFSSCQNSKGNPEEVLSPEIISKMSENIAATIFNDLGDIHPQFENILYQTISTAIQNYDETIRILADPKRPAERDSGLILSFKIADTQDKLIAWKQNTRGYSIGLRAGIKKTDGKDNPIWLTGNPWITDTAIYDQKAKNWLQENNITARVHATIVDSIDKAGAKFDEISYCQTYLGAPLKSTRVESIKNPFLIDGIKDFDETDTMDYLWPMDGKFDSSLPPLGYGLCYQGIAVALDNVGAVIDKKLRDEKVLTKLRTSIDNAFKDHNDKDCEIFKYLSKEIPSSPNISIFSGDKKAHNPSIYELTTETRAHEFHKTQGHDNGQLPQVAVLANDMCLTDKPKSYELRIKLPATHSDFIERWLNTDIEAKKLDEKSLLSDPTFSNNAINDENPIRVLRDEIIKNLKPSTEPRTFKNYHPAVAAFGVVVLFNGENDESEEKIGVIEVNRTTWNDRHKKIDLIDQEACISLKVESGNNFYKSHEPIKIEPGSFASIRVYSLIPKTFFATNSDGDECSLKRYHFALSDKDGKVKPKPFNDPNGKIYKEYFGFSPVEFWFENMPNWNDSNSIKDLSLKIISRDLNMRNRTQLIAYSSQGAIPASWISGMSIQRHEWHWTGYPVQFPSIQNELDKWAVTFSGVESYRESFEHRFSTSDNAGDWTIGHDGKSTNIMHVRQLSEGPRPSRYSAYTARPLVRFRKWLDPKKVGADDNNSPLSLEKKIFATGTLVPGIPTPISANQRLPTPVLKWSIPLTSTYGVNDQPRDQSPNYLPKRIPNGNLLVFDESIRRTDSLAYTGGIGEIFEIDLMETRVVKIPDGLGKEYSLHEIGPNPIFHAKPLDIVKDEKINQPKLKALEPFGLTYDVVRNALVAQTAMVVYPEEAKGKWIMAKARVRRLILPETILDEPVDLKNNSFSLGLRLEGKELIPLDFCIDLDEKDELSRLKIGTITEPDGKNLNLPEFPEDSKNRNKRLLFTWHKGRWQGGGNPTWRLQILGQRQINGSLNWETIVSQSCFEQPNSDFELALINSTNNKLNYWYQGTINIARDSVKLLRVSDYTDPRWLTFIGMFENANLGRADQYVLKASKDKEFLSLLLNVKDGNENGFPKLNKPPKEPADWRFSASLFSDRDIENITFLINKFTSDKNSSTKDISVFIKEKFGEPTIKLLLDQESTLQQRRETLVSALNRVIQGDSIFEENRFKGVNLSAETERLAKRLKENKLSREDLTRFNRLLLEDTYPVGIVRNQNVTFHLLLVFRPLADITRGEMDTNSGAYVGIYGASIEGGKFKKIELSIEDLKGCFAYLCSFQRINAVSNVEINTKIESWDELITNMFPEQNNPGTVEAKIRMLPEYLGPLQIESE